jgi:parvulin-like peptidyl-prolyl isomerase
MGLMNRLRDKTHIILIILVLAFLATIVFEWGMNYLGLRSGTVTELGLVNGEEISYTEFENQVQLALEQQKQQTGEDPDETMVQMIRDQVWEQMVTQILARQEIEKLGIRVTNQEILNWVYNSPQTLPEPIQRNFVDSTGQFNMSIYQQALATKTPEIQKFWSQVEEYLKQTLLSQKLQSVITGTVRVSEGDILQKFKDDNISADFDYALFDITSIPDEQVQITEDDLRAYYEKNKEDLKMDESVRMKYVIFSDMPNADDSTLTEKQLRALVKEFKSYAVVDSNMISFINTYSTNKFNDSYSKPNELSPQVLDYLFSAKKDSISDVIKANDGYHLVRLIDTKEGEDVFVNASHILVNFGTDSNAAKVKSEQILERLRDQEEFSKLAQDLSEDEGSKANGGNLGWFTKGAMVKEFEQAAMNASIGAIVGPIKTQFGYHIIKIHDRQKKQFKAADIKMLVKTSPKTKDVIRKRAEDFSYITGKGGFEEEAAKINMKVQETPSITKGSFVPGAGTNKAVISFAFKESNNSVSSPFKVQGGYAVYKIVDKIPPGYMNYEEIKLNVLTPRVKIEKKLDMLKQAAEGVKSNISGNDLASIRQMNPAAVIKSVDSFSVANPKEVGSDFEFTNALFRLQDGQVSEPIRTQKGYYLVKMKRMTPFDQQKYAAESETIRQTLTMQKKQAIVQEWITELKENAAIVDNRDKFFR